MCMTCAGDRASIYTYPEKKDLVKPGLPISAKGNIVMGGASWCSKSMRALESVLALEYMWALNGRLVACGVFKRMNRMSTTHSDKATQL